MDFRGLELRRAEAHRRRAPARHERHRAEILVARDVGPPAAFPSLHQAALRAANDDELNAEIFCEALADGERIRPFDDAEIGMDQQAGAGMSDAFEIVEGGDRGRLAILSARDTDADGGMLAKQIAQDRIDRDRRQRGREARTR